MLFLPQVKVLLLVLLFRTPEASATATVCEDSPQSLGDHSSSFCVAPTEETTMSTPLARRSIALLTGSTRTPRVGPSVSAFIETVLAPKLEESPYTLTSINLGSWKLPLFNEQVIPAQLPADDPTSGYAHELSKAWSKEIRSHDAVVFVTPQYNGGYPASLKNAIDYLYHEWVGKPAMVISYGGRGGSKATEQLLPILGAVKMKVTKVSPALALGRSMGSAMREGALVEGQAEDWLKAGVGEQVSMAWDELVGLLEDIPTSRL